MSVNYEKIAKRFAKSEGYDDVEYVGQWEGREVFCAVSKEPAFIGLPPYILIDNDNARWPSADEEETLFKLF